MALCQDEVPPEDFMYATSYKKTITTFGFEIEQQPGDIPLRLRRIYHWHPDGSGPLETTFGGGAFPAAEVKKFVQHVLKIGPWEWKSEYMGRRPREHYDSLMGCGSHIHLRVREDLIPREQLLEAWTTAYNTLIECVPLLTPMFIWGHRGRDFIPRKSLLTWAPIQTKRMSTAEMEPYLRDPTTFLREYKDVTMNPARAEGSRTAEQRGSAKPLTMEVRTCETHISFAYVVALLLNHFIRDSIERGFLSPKLRDRERVLESITHAIKKSIEDQKSLYLKMNEEVGPLDFMPGRSIPNMQEHYASWKDFFKDLFRNHTAQHPPVARVMTLYKAQGIPCENNDAAWHLFDPMGQFHWDQNIPVLN